jgi:AcrR family transcriptional regulator
VGHRHDRDTLLAAAVEYALEHGITQLTYGRLAQHLGIADRTIVYYFDTKDRLIEAVVEQLGMQLMAVLDRAFGPDPLTADELLRRSWPVLATTKSDPVFGLFFEVSGAAAAGHEPYRTLAQSIMTIWAEWMTTKLDSENAKLDALRVMATIDGLLLVRHTLSARAATEAARAMGVFG